MGLRCGTLAPAFRSFSVGFGFGCCGWHVWLNLWWFIIEFESAPDAYKLLVTDNDDFVWVKRELCTCGCEGDAGECCAEFADEARELLTLVDDSSENGPDSDILTPV